MKKIIIVGGGVAGLTAGIYARQQGFESVIYEKNAVAGGACMGWTRKGSYIDGCIHWMTGTNPDDPLYRIWENVGALGDVDVATPESFATFWFPDETVTFYNNLEALEKELLRVAPEDRKEIKRLIKSIKKSIGMKIPCALPFDMMGGGELAKLGLSMLPYMGIVKRYGAISLKEYAKQFKSPYLQEALQSIFPGGGDYNVQSLIASLATVIGNNGGIPKGGSLGVVKRMAKRFEELGGTLHTGIEVKSILQKEGKAVGICLADGEEVFGDYIIASCDIHHTLDTLLEKQIELEDYQIRDEDENRYPVSSVVMAAFKTFEPVDMLPTMLYANVSPFSLGSNKSDLIGIRNFAYDPTLSKDGSTVLEAICTTYSADYAAWAAMDETTYQENKQKLGLDCQARIEEVYPQLKGKIELLDVVTPMTFTHYLHAYKGAFMAYAMTPGGKQMMRGNTIPALSNLILATQWLMMPGGLPVALIQGKFAIQRICKEEGKEYRF